MKLGFNSVLFGGYDLEESFKYAAVCGYDGLELSAIEGDMHKSPHFIAAQWREFAPRIKELSRKYNVSILAMEQPAQDPTRMENAMQAAVEIGIPIVNCGPGGKANDESTFGPVVESLSKLARRAEHYGITLCAKAHVGNYVYNTPTSLKLLAAIDSPNFGLDMDPSHIYRAGENPVEAIGAVVKRIKHVHVRDCKGRQSGPGPAALQANGRGDIDLIGYLSVLHENGYTGPLDLEVIGARDLELPQCVAIAAEARGHMQACLQACGAR
ncbi:MAG TPA: sugar phosphate isomerase/epimerase [Tepidisphaeraceae bacterium]|jgi:sugar phosphate isomerase/epimerase|nr:sugar phosphate isomerase/epimerase [Tepidisphaeraceae bacterium]